MPIDTGFSTNIGLLCLIKISNICGVVSVVDDKIIASQSFLDLANLYGSFHTLVILCLFAKCLTLVELNLDWRVYFFGC